VADRKRCGRIVVTSRHLAAGSRRTYDGRRTGPVARTQRRPSQPAIVPKWPPAPADPFSSRGETGARLAKPLSRQGEKAIGQAWPGTLGWKHVGSQLHLHDSLFIATRLLACHATISSNGWSIGRRSRVVVVMGRGSFVTNSRGQEHSAEINIGSRYFWPRKNWSSSRPLLLL